MKKLLLIFTLLLFTVCIYAADVKLDIPDIPDVEAGTTFDFPVVITSPANYSNARSELSLPEGWNNVIPNAPINLAASNKLTVVSIIYVPTTVKEGSYEISYKLYSEKGELIGSTTKAINVKPLIATNISIIDAPSIMIYGDTYNLKALVTNDGNTILNLGLTAEAVSKVSLSVHNLVLNPGESEVIDIVLSKPTGNPFGRTIETLILSAEDLKQNLSEKSYWQAPLVFRNGRPESMFLEYPLSSLLFIKLFNGRLNEYSISLYSSAKCLIGGRYKTNSGSGLNVTFGMLSW